MTILGLGMFIGLILGIGQIQYNRAHVDPRTPAQRRAMREDCRSKGL